MSGINLSSNDKDPRRIIEAIQQITQGRTNAGGSVTLTANAASTTVTAQVCGSGAGVFLFPKTANAAAALATTYVGTVSNGSFVITHANNAQADKSFFWIALG